MQSFFGELHFLQINKDMIDRRNNILSVFFISCLEK
nr:MAG TPA: hypothetical protein [Caudoviricetes sp.]